MNKFFSYLFVLGILLFPSFSFASLITPEDILNGVNNERIKANVGVLERDPVLDMAANAKLEDIQKNRYFAHRNPDTNSYFFKFMPYSRNRGEVLARGFKLSERVIRAWLNSPTHKHAILEKAYHKTGIAVTEDMVVQVFANEQTLTVQEYELQLQQILATNF